MWNCQTWKSTVICREALNSSSYPWLCQWLFVQRVAKIGEILAQAVILYPNGYIFLQFQHCSHLLLTNSFEQLSCCSFLRWTLHFSCQHFLVSTIFSSFLYLHVFTFRTIAIFSLACQRLQWMLYILLMLSVYCYLLYEVIYFSVW